MVYIGPKLIFLSLLYLTYFYLIFQVFKVDVFFRQSWRDPRLRFNGTDELRLNTVMLDSIWYPDTYFLNGKSSKRHVVTTPNALFRINPNGNVLYTQR